MPQNALLAVCCFCQAANGRWFPPTPPSPGDGISLLRMPDGPDRMDGVRVPTKSVPARMIEDAVLEQFRTALRVQETRLQLNVSEADWHAFEEGRRELVRSLVKQVSYDGTTGAVSLNLRLRPTMKIEFAVPLRRVRAPWTLLVATIPEPESRPPRIARLLALAHKLDALVRTGHSLLLRRIGSPGPHYAGTPYADHGPFASGAVDPGVPSVYFHSGRSVHYGVRVCVKLRATAMGPPAQTLRTPLKK